MNNGYLGIDVSKGYSDFVLLDDALQALSKPIQFDDTWAGHQRLLSWLSGCMNRYTIDQLYAGMESTGGFEDNWYALLIGAGLPLRVARVNPLAVKNAAKASLS